MTGVVGNGGNDKRDDQPKTDAAAKRSPELSEAVGEQGDTRQRLRCAAPRSHTPNATASQFPPALESREWTADR